MKEIINENNYLSLTNNSPLKIYNVEQSFKFEEFFNKKNINKNNYLVLVNGKKVSNNYECLKNDKILVLPNLNLSIENVLK